MDDRKGNEFRTGGNAAPDGRAASGDSGWPYEPDREFERVFDEIRAGESGPSAKPAGGEPQPPRKESGGGGKTSCRKAAKRICAGLMLLTGLYCIAVFSDIPFISKWRTIYIETAMSTMTHQWLATAFIPKSVVDKVVAEDQNLSEQQAGLSSRWSVSALSKKDLYLPWKKEESKFFQIYGEIDPDSFKAYMEGHAGEAVNAHGYLVIDKAGLQDGGTSIRTVFGDQVLAVDTRNAVTIVLIRGEGYVGRLAIVKDPSRVGLGLSRNFDRKGAQVADIAEYNGAVLAINASGFYDPSGKGNGGDAYGLVVSGGKILKNALGGTFKAVGFDGKNQLNIEPYHSASRFRDAVEFKPALIVNGEIKVSGSAGWGIQPRSAIGQTKNGEVLLLIVDGRAPGYSIGCTVGEAAKILKRYGAYQACNLDGGSSSLMYYNGREISRPSAADKTKGRSVPDGFVVYSNGAAS